MERVLERCCGLDVHKKTVAACIRIPGKKKGQREQEVRTFGTTTRELLELRDWLEANGVTHVAMESTGIYWKPIFYVLEGAFIYVLEGAFSCLLANAAHIAQVPGRKTDVKDCVWIAQLLEHGLLRGSFVPEAPIRDLRDVTRYRKGLVQERTRVSNRLHKVLEDAGIKLASVATRVLGVSGRAMMEALVAGTTEPAVLADLAKGRLREKLPALREVSGRSHSGSQRADRDAHGTVRGGDRAAGHDSRRESPNCRGPDRRDGGGHESVSLCETPGELGGAVPREQRERRQANGGNGAEGQPLAEDGARGGGVVCLTFQGQRPRGALPAGHAAPWTQEGGHRGGARDPDQRLLHALSSGALPGAGAGLLRPSPRRTGPSPRGADPRTPGLSGDSGAGSITRPSSPAARAFLSKGRDTRPCVPCPLHVA